jgi:hypothetical protein
MPRLNDPFPMDVMLMETYPWSDIFTGTMNLDYASLG